MAQHRADIIIIGGGIAGLWTLNRLSRMGYNALLLENNALGGGQSIASQGIIHSGLKYALAGKISALAQSISAMPDLWRRALEGKDLSAEDVDLSQAQIRAPSQIMLIPAGLTGGIIKIAAKKALGNSVRDIPASQWPEALQNSGFMGSAIFMGEPVIDVPSVIKALAAPYQDRIRKADIDFARDIAESENDVRVTIGAETITAAKIIFTAAQGNHPAATMRLQDKGLKTQRRPLLMGMLRSAPFEIYAHLIGAAEKPVATITTHKDAQGRLVWYIGGQVAEREKDVPAQETIRAIEFAFQKYFPALSLEAAQWAVLPIDRHEGSSATEGWMPDTPTLHSIGRSIYGWPTKLTFAPLLADKIIKKLDEDGIAPSQSVTDWSWLLAAPYAKAPWDRNEDRNEDRDGDEDEENMQWR
ncbi:MAG: FAD-dependent oxidoreductase [Alphaproteobacteria bacterium]